MIISAIVAAVAFTAAGIGGSEITRKLHPKSDELDKERKRHDLATERLQRDHDRWSEQRSKIYDFLQNQKLIKSVAAYDFKVTDSNLRLYKDYHQDEEDNYPDEDIILKREPKLSDYYQPSPEMKKYQYIFVVGVMAGGVFIIKKYIRVN